MVFSWRSGFASVCILTALTAFIIFAWDKASGLSPEERREIAILKILGWQTADILLMRFWEGLLVSMLAFVTGYLAAFVHVVFFSAGFFLPVLVGWSVLVPDITLVPDIVLSDILLVLSFSVLPYMAATVIPAWRSAIIAPDSVMH
jgi:ABC-type lipoprotein release transport system permease subunit